MHRCSSSRHQQQGNTVGAPCSCGLFHGQSNSFSMFFSMPNNHQCYKSFDENEHMYPFASPSFSAASSSTVDCTLSLGTPSTRLTEDDDKRMSSSYSSSSRRHNHHHHSNTERPFPASSSSSCMSNFCWDILQPKNNTAAAPTQPNSNKAVARGNSDPLLARRCANCDTTSTPLWRNGPRGPKSLCNACGIRFKKEERRATAASGNTSTYINANASAAATGGIEMEQQHYGSSYQYHQNGGSGGSTSWGGLQSQKVACFSPANEFRFIEESDRDSSDTGGIPFLSWRLNVTDRPSLVHDFTR